MPWLRPRPESQFSEHPQRSPEPTSTHASTTGLSSAVEKPLSNPPALQGVEAPTEAVVTLTPTKFTFELEGEPDNAADLKLIIMASAPQSNGVTRAYGKAVQIAQPLEAVCEEYDIKEDFDNKHGAPNAAAPKVFMKYLGIVI